MDSSGLEFLSQGSVAPKTMIEQSKGFPRRDSSSGIESEKGNQYITALIGIPPQILGSRTKVASNLAAGDLQLGPIGIDPTGCHHLLSDTK
jgi:hypothetical protein